MWILTLCITILPVFSSSALMEPESGIVFPEQIQAEDQLLELTGADIRRWGGVIVYAIAHYATKDNNVASSNTEEMLSQYIEMEIPKAIVLKGTRRVPLRAIRWSWEDSLSRAGYQGQYLDVFVSAFTKRFERDSTLILLATPDNTLKAIQDDILIGSWQDEELISAVWQVSLGIGSEVVTRENLVPRGHLISAEEPARFSGASPQVAVELDDASYQ